MKDIEILEQYILNKLSKTDINTIENRIKNEPPFALLFNEIKTTIAALERNWLNKQLIIARKQIILKKAIKIGIISIGALFILAFSVYKISAKKEKNSSDKLLKNKISIVENKTELKDSTILKDTNFKYLKIKNTLTTPSVILIQPTTNFSQPFELTNTKIKNDSFSSFNFENLYQPEIQIFKIDPKIDNIIKCKYGTIINIQANTLVNLKEVPISKPVTLTVQEYTNYMQMWQQRVTTISDSNMLISAGSCYITTKYNDEELRLKKDANYSIQFAEKKDKEMKIFEGIKLADGEINWNLKQPKDCNCDKKSQDKNFKLNVDFEAQLNDTLFFLTPTVSDEGYYGKDYTYNNLPNEKLKSIFDTFKTLRSPVIVKLLKKKKQIQFRFGIDEYGYLSKYDYNFKTTRKFDKQLKACAEAIIKNTKINLPPNSAFGTKIINLNLLPKAVISKNINIDTANDKNNQKSKAISELNTLIVDHFGYVNADKFYKILRKESIKISIPNKYTDVRIFFKNYNSVIKCYNQDTIAFFYQAPKSEPILIVATMVKNNQTFQIIMEAKVGDKIKLENFEPYNFSILENRLNTYR